MEIVKLKLKWDFLKEIKANLNNPKHLETMKNELLNGIYKEEEEEEEIYKGNENLNELIKKRNELEIEFMHKKM
jgi:sRNA-binding carbon storage regulator CsrA